MCVEKCAVEIMDRVQANRAEPDEVLTNLTKMSFVKTTDSHQDTV